MGKKPVNDADVTEEVVETVKEVMGESHQVKARQLAATLLGVFKIKGWEIVGGEEVDEAEVENLPRFPQNEDLGRLGLNSRADPGSG